MTNFKRGTAHASGEVDVSADDFWAMLRDWGAVMKWAAKGPDAPAPLIDTIYKDGDSVDVLPCTRICLFAPESGFPPFPETLIHADPVARRIYYNVEGVVSGGMQNYLATTWVDELGPNRCRVTLQSTFDIPADAEVGPVRDFLEAVYNKSVIQGMAAAVKQEKAVLVGA